MQTVLPVLSRLLGDCKGEVRQSAGEALRGVASLMRPGDLGQYVLTIVLQLAHDDSNEELVSHLTLQNKQGIVKSRYIACALATLANNTC
jgi:hypothetical protein